MCFEKMLWGISKTVQMLELANRCHFCSALPENFLAGINGALGIKESHFLSKNVF